MINPNIVKGLTIAAAASVGMVMTALQNYIDDKRINAKVDRAAESIKRDLYQEVDHQMGQFQEDFIAFMEDREFGQNQKPRKPRPEGSEGQDEDSRHASG